MGKSEISPQVAQAASLCSNNKDNRQAACATLPDSGYFNPYATIDTHRRNLPHWRQDDVWYFVTYRLADSIPQSAITALEAEREQWLAAHPEPRTDAQKNEYWERFGGRIHDLLDAGSGECWLRKGEVRDVVVESMLYGEAKRYRLDAWVVMPNHVHVLVMPVNNIDLSKILHTWKSYTANRINRMLVRKGKLWQDESYNHIVRNPIAFQKIREYILNNPAKAKLGENEYTVAQAASLCSDPDQNRQAACSTFKHHDRD